MTPTMKKAFPSAGLYLYNACTQKSLPDRTATEHSVIRDEFAQELNNVDPQKFPRGSMMEITDVYEEAVGLSAQFTWHQLHAHCCCDGIVRTYLGRRLQRRSYWSFGSVNPDKTLAQAIDGSRVPVEFIDRDFCSIVLSLFWLICTSQDAVCQIYCFQNPLILFVRTTLEAPTTA